MPFPSVFAWVRPSSAVLSNPLTPTVAAACIAASVGVALAGGIAGCDDPNSSGGPTAAAPTGSGPLATDARRYDDFEDAPAMDLNRYTDDINAWHAERIETLTAPDGWLTLVALDWLSAGERTIGSGPDSDVRYEGFPAERLGTIEVPVIDDILGPPDAVAFTPAPGVVLGGIPADGMLLTDAGDAPATVVTAGDCRFMVIVRAGRLVVRIKDAAAATRTAFPGIDRYDVDPIWRFKAEFRPADPEERMDVGSVIGSVDATPVAGRARFTYGSNVIDLVLNPSAPGRYFVCFGDDTNRGGTYPGGRFVYAEAVATPDADSAEPPTHVIVDFNRAFNPPCSFTEYATCPVPVADNRLPFAVPAGERWSRERFDVGSSHGQ